MLGCSAAVMETQSPSQLKTRGDPQNMDIGHGRGLSGDADRLLGPP